MISTVAVDITNHCNFDCIHCIRDKLSPRAHLSLELLDFILKEVSSVGIREISFTGGEIALHPDLKNIFELVSKHKLYFNFVTNGYLFKEKILPVINPGIKKYLSGICFSLDGATPETHDFIRKKGSFKKVIGAIASCVKEGIEVSVKSIIYNRNINEIPDIAMLCASLGVRDVGFIVLTPSPRMVKAGLMPSPDEYRDIIRYIQSSIISSFSIDINIEGYSDDDRMFRFCNPAYGLSIDHEGNFIFCCNLSHPAADSKPDNFGKEFLGNIRQIGIQEGIIRHYQLLAWFMEKTIKSPIFQDLPGGACTACYYLFDKMNWIKDYETPYNRYH